MTHPLLHAIFSYQYHINKGIMLRNSLKLVSLSMWMWIGTGGMAQGWNSDQKKTDKIVFNWTIFASHCELDQGCALLVSDSQAIPSAHLIPWRAGRRDAELWKCLPSMVRADHAGGRGEVGNGHGHGKPQLALNTDPPIPVNPWGEMVPFQKGLENFILHACPAPVVYGCCSRQHILHLIQQLGKKMWCNRKPDCKGATKSTRPLPSKGTLPVENNIGFKFTFILVLSPN